MGNDIRKTIEDKFFNKWCVIRQPGGNAYVYPFRWGRHSRRDIKCKSYVRYIEGDYYYDNDGHYSMSVETCLDGEFSLLEESNEMYSFLYAKIAKGFLNG